MTLNDVAGDFREEWVTWTLLRDSSSGIPPSTVSRMGSQRDFQTKCNLRLGQEEGPWVLPLHSLEARKVLRAGHTGEVGLSSGGGNPALQPLLR